MPSSKGTSAWSGSSRSVAVPTCGKSNVAHVSRGVELTPGRALRDHPRGARRHRRLRRRRRRARHCAGSRRTGPSAICVAEAFAPDDAWERARGCRARGRTRLAGLHLERADRAVRARAADGHRRAQRRHHADRVAHGGARRAGRARRPGIRRLDHGDARDGGPPTSRGSAAARPRTLYSGPAASVRRRPAPRTASPTPSSSRSAALRRTWPSIRTGRPVDVVRAGGDATPRIRALDVRVVGVAVARCCGCARRRRVRRRAAQRAHRQARATSCFVAARAPCRTPKPSRSRRRRGSGRLPDPCVSQATSLRPDEHLRGNSLARRIRATTGRIAGCRPGRAFEWPGGTCGWPARRSHGGCSKPRAAPSASSSSAVAARPRARSARARRARRRRRRRSAGTSRRCVGRVHRAPPEPR